MVDRIVTAPAPAETTVVGKKCKFRVAKGKSITSKRGILSAGQTVCAKDFPGGEETLKQLIDRKLVTK